MSSIQPTESGKWARIPLRNKAGEVVAYTVVDSEDLVMLSRSTWHLNDNGYAATNVRINGRFRRILMHRKLLGLALGDPRCCDHINRDRVDNRRSNLRIVSRKENGQNTTGQRTAASPYRGVSREPRLDKWRARVILSGKPHFLGNFDTEEEAAAIAAAFRAEHMPFSQEAMAKAA